MLRPKYKAVVVRTSTMQGGPGSSGLMGTLEGAEERHPDYVGIYTHMQDALDDLEDEGYRVMQTVGLKSGFAKTKRYGGFGYSCT